MRVAVIKQTMIEHTSGMKDRTEVFKKVLPSLLLLMVIIVLAALSFIPAFNSAPSAIVRSAAVDDSALAALSSCRAYLDGHDFKTASTGEIRAKVFGIPYAQKLKGGRTVCGDCVVEFGESASAFAKAAVRTEYRDGAYYAVRGDYKAKSFVYGEPCELSRADFYGAYGKPASGLVKYELDGAIVSAEQRGDNTYLFVLDPSRAVEYSRCAVKTALGSSAFPEYSRVEFTLYTRSVIHIRSCPRNQGCSSRWSPYP